MIQRAHLTTSCNVQERAYTLGARWDPEFGAIRNLASLKNSTYLAG